MTAHIDVGFSKCLNFCNIERKLKKMMPPTRLSDQKFKKAEKCLYFTAGLSKII